MAGTQLVVIDKLDPIYADFTVTEAELARVQEYMAKGTLTVRVMTPADADLQAAAEHPPVPQPTSAPPGTSVPDDKSVAMVNRPPTTGPAMATAMSTTTTGPATAAAVPFQPRTGKLVFLDNAVQDASGTVQMRALLDNADHHFWPNQYVNVRLVLATEPSVLVPVDATQVSQQGLFVYKVTPNANSPTKVVATQQTVTLGQRHGDLVVVKTGLGAGDTIVGSGFTMLQPDAPIMVINAGPPPTAAPAGPPTQVGPGVMKSPGPAGQVKAGPPVSMSRTTEGGRL